MILLAERGRVRIAIGELERGLADLLEAQRITSDGGCDLSVLADWVPDAAIALVALGKHDDARELATRELAAARAFGARRRYGAAMGVCGSLDSGDHGLATLREAVAILERSPS